MADAAPTKVLMIYPRFGENSFWNYRTTSELLGAKYPTAPLGLITVAAMLPAHWEVRLVNRNTEELSDADIEWADMVMTGGMIVQQVDALHLVRLCQSRGKPVVIGGPDATSSPHVYESADFRVLGEAEGVLTEFIAAWDAGARSGTFEAVKFQADVTASPVPRFDLLKFKDYLFVGVQFSRGCPFTCEFCDIIELYGRVPRTKKSDQLLRELDALYALGYRGHVDFVDDNLVGNKKSLRAFLPILKEWQEAHDYPFEFSTEASMNLADDAEILAAMRDCGFFALFVGIESPNEETLVATSKKQNARRSLVDSVQRIYDHGMFVTAGFILGFDSEAAHVGKPMADFIEEAAIGVSMVGLLYALPNTQLTRRLAKEERLFAGHEKMPEAGGDQCINGLNYRTLRPRRDILADYREVLARIYDPVEYCERVERLIARLDLSRSKRSPTLNRGGMGNITALYRIVSAVPEWKELLWGTFQRCVAANPLAARQVVTLLGLYLHLGPFAQRVIEQIDQQIVEIDAGTFAAPPYAEQLAMSA